MRNARRNMLSMRLRSNSPEARPGGFNHLRRIVPLVNGGADIEPLIALQRMSLRPGFRRTWQSPFPHARSPSRNRRPHLEREEYHCANSRRPHNHGFQQDSVSSMDLGNCRHHASRPKEIRKDSPCGSHPSMGLLFGRFTARRARSRSEGPVFSRGVHVGIQSLGLGGNSGKGRTAKPWKEPLPCRQRTP